MSRPTGTGGLGSCSGRPSAPHPLKKALWPGSQDDLRAPAPGSRGYVPPTLRTKAAPGAARARKPSLKDSRGVTPLSFPSEDAIPIYPAETCSLSEPHGVAHQHTNPLILIRHLELHLERYAARQLVWDCGAPPGPFKSWTSSRPRAKWPAALRRTLPR